MDDTWNFQVSHQLHSANTLQSDIGLFYPVVLNCEEKENKNNLSNIEMHLVSSTDYSQNNIFVYIHLVHIAYHGFCLRPNGPK